MCLGGPGDPDISLYVDDGCIFAASKTFSGVVTKLCHMASLVGDWLSHVGLQVDSDKSELMFFHSPRISRHRGIPPSSVPFSMGLSSFTLKLASQIHYLGIFFTPSLH